MNKASEVPQVNRLTAALRRVFGIDLRSLAVFRMMLALVLCADLLERLKNVEAYYTEQGMLPQAAIDQIYGGAIRWTSLHYHTGGNVWLQSLVILFGIGVGVSLFCGYRTKLATFISWILIVSLNRRASGLCSGADDVMRLMLMWSFFLPLGARWSVDANRVRRMRPDEPTGDRFFSAGTCAILLQVCFIYLFTAIMKFNGTQWLDGTALQSALQFEVHVRPLGVWLSEQNLTLLKTFTVATLFAELCMPFIALCPFRHPYARWIAILAMWSLHAGIAMFMTIGTFPFACMACWLLFIPSESWDWLLSKHQDDSQVEVRRTFEHSSFATWLVTAMILFVAVLNVLGIKQLNDRGIRAPSVMKQIAQVTRLNQKWSMYAPVPIVDCWFVMPAERQDGSTIDVFGRKQISYEKPVVVSASYPSVRIRKLLLSNCQHVESPLWSWMVKHYAEQWNRENPTNQVVRVQATYIGERTHNAKPLMVEPYIEYDLRTGGLRRLSEEELIQPTAVQD